ncbi:MAG TPA: hypothetical protein VF489_04135 [Sphingobium sp.]
MNNFFKSIKRPAACLPFGRSSEQAARPGAQATLSRIELQRAVAAMLG